MLYTLIHDLRLQWTNETLLYKNISLILFSKGAHCLLLVWEIDGETYTQKGDFLLSHTFFQEPGGANTCTLLRAVWSETLTPLLSCVSLARLPILCTQSKSDRVVITWSPSGYTPVRPDCHDALSSPCLLITTWRLVKVHGVTRNQPKIHVICYITFKVCLLNGISTIVGNLMLKPS